MSRVREPSEPSCYCKQCGYDLRLLESTLCPECGREFDPADPATFRRRPPRGRLYWWVTRTAGTALLTILLFSAWLGWMYWGWKQERNIIAEYKIVRASGCGGVPNNYYYSNFIIIPKALTRWLGAERCFLFERVSTLDLMNNQQFAGLNSADDLVSDLEIKSPKSVRKTDLTIQILRHLDTFNHLKDLQLYALNINNLDFLSQVPHLEQLNLIGIPITDADMSILHSLHQLTSLGIRNMNISDSGFQFFNNWSSLTWLALDGTKADDQTIHRLRNNTVLAILYLGYTVVSDACLTDISTLTHLSTLDLPNTSIGDEGLKQIQNMPELKYLNLNQTKITEAGLPFIAKLKKLTSLRMNHVVITREGIKQLLACPNLYEVSFDVSKITVDDLELLATQSKITRLQQKGTFMENPDKLAQFKKQYPKFDIYKGYD